MTCIVAALCPDGGAVMGSESMVTLGDQSAVTTDPKIHRAGRWLVGFSGDDSAIIDLERTLRAFRRKSRPMTRVRAGANSIWELWQTLPGEWEAIVTDGREIYTVTRGHTLQHASQYWAIGSGSEYALGALWVNAGPSATARVRMAVGAAVAHSSSCGGAIQTLEI